MDCSIWLLQEIYMDIMAWNSEATIADIIYGTIGIYFLARFLRWMGKDIDKQCAEFDEMQW